MAQDVHQIIINPRSSRALRLAHDGSPRDGGRSSWSASQSMVRRRCVPNEVDQYVLFPKSSNIFPHSRAYDTLRETRDCQEDIVRFCQSHARIVEINSMPGRRPYTLLPVNQPQRVTMEPTLWCQPCQSRPIGNIDSTALTRPILHTLPYHFFLAKWRTRGLNSPS